MLSYDLLYQLNIASLLVLFQMPLTLPFRHLFSLQCFPLHPFLAFSFQPRQECNKPDQCDIQLQCSYQRWILVFENSAASHYTFERLLLPFDEKCKNLPVLTKPLYHKTAGFSNIYKEFSGFPGFGGSHFRTALGCSGERPSSSQRSC